MQQRRRWVLTLACASSVIAYGQLFAQSRGSSARTRSPPNMPQAFAAVHDSLRLYCVGLAGGLRAL